MSGLGILILIIFSLFSKIHKFACFCSLFLITTYVACFKQQNILHIVDGLQMYGVVAGFLFALYFLAIFIGKSRTYRFYPIDITLVSIASLFTLDDMIKTYRSQIIDNQLLGLLYSLFAVVLTIVCIYAYFNYFYLRKVQQNDGGESPVISSLAKINRYAGYSILFFFIFTYYYGIWQKQNTRNMSVDTNLSIHEVENKCDNSEYNHVLVDGTFDDAVYVICSKGGWFANKEIYRIKY